MRFSFLTKFVLALCVLGAAVAAKADFSIQLDAGRLTQTANMPLPQGSLLIMVAAGADGVFSTNITPGHFTGGDDILLAMSTTGSGAGGFNNNVGTAETSNLITVNTQNLSLTVGNQIALLWFPQISYTQFQAGVTPVAGNTFGLYNPVFYGNSTDKPDGGDLWQVPVGGLINLNFLTTNADPPPGTQNPMEGFSQFTVIPEPASMALFITGCGGAAALVLRRRRA